MSKCWKCGRRGLFLKTDYSGICINCKIAEEARKAELEDQQRRIAQQRAYDLALFRDVAFPITSPDSLIQQTWNYWDMDVHNSERQIQEQIKALYEAIPILIDTKKISGIFISITTEFYETTLTTCTCSHFKVNSQPCMHMYRLFHDLVMPEKRNNQIVDVNADLIDKFYSLDEKCRKHFVDRIRYWDSDGCDCLLREELSKEVEVGLLKASNVVDYTKFLNQMTKDEIILALAKKGIQGFRPSWSKVKLIAWVLENNQDFLCKYFKNCAHLSVGQDVLAWGEGIKHSRDSWRVVHPHSLREVCKEFIT